VLAGMGANTSIAGVQQTGCRALRKLTSNNEANSAAIARTGGIEAVVAGMRAHTSIVGVEQEGRRALKILECRSGEDRRR
jgi:hypothetical protein